MEFSYRSAINVKQFLSKFMFSAKQYVLMTTHDNENNLHGWRIELSFVALLVIYIIILGIIMFTIFLILKLLTSLDTEEDSTDALHVAAVEEILSERTPMLMEEPEKPVTVVIERDDDETASSSSSEDLNQTAKLCVICYEEPKNCFFVPCGHCATCHACAKKLLEADTKSCPICRKVIRKARRLTRP